MGDLVSGKWLPVASAGRDLYRRVCRHLNGRTDGNSWRGASADRDSLSRHTGVRRTLEAVKALRCGRMRLTGSAFGRGPQQVAADRRSEVSNRFGDEGLS